MKKKGVIETLVKAGIAVAAVGGTLYLLKDKLEEDPKYKEAIDKVKDTIKSYVPSKEEPIDEDDFFDEDFDEIIHTSSSERGYVNIKLPTDEELEDSAAPVVEDVEPEIEEFIEKTTEE